MAYQYTEQMRSCAVDKALLADLEAILKSAAKEHGPLDSREPILQTELRIVDPFGSETYGAVKEYDRSQFSSDVAGVKLSLTQIHGRVRRAEVCFGMNRYSTKVSIDVDGAGGKHVALSISRALKARIAESANLNWLFHHPITATIQFTLTLLGMFLLFRAYVFGTASEQEPWRWPAFAFAVLMWGWLALEWASPYVEYDTARRRRINDGKQLLLHGLFGAIVLGMLSGIIWR